MNNNNNNTNEHDLIYSHVDKRLFYTKLEHLKRLNNEFVNKKRNSYYFH